MNFLASTSLRFLCVEMLKPNSTYSELAIIITSKFKSWHSLQPLFSEDTNQRKSNLWWVCCVHISTSRTKKTMQCTYWLSVSPGSKSSAVIKLQDLLARISCLGHKTIIFLISRVLLLIQNEMEMFAICILLKEHQTKDDFELKVQCSF